MIRATQKLTELALTMKDELIRTDKDHVVYLRLNRPDKLNTLSENVIGRLEQEIESINADPDVRCVVISAEGRAFCAGHDLEQMRSNPEHAYYQTLFKRCGKMMQSLLSLPVPVIAQVHGAAVAAGCQLVASCDLAIAGKRAKFAVPGINLGLFCSTPAVALSRSVSAKRAFDMLVTGDMISAETAVESGLISEVVEDDDLEYAVQAKVEKILSKNAAAIRFGKTMFHPQRQMDLAEAYDFAAEVMAQNMMDPGATEGIDRFLGR